MIDLIFVQIAMYEFIQTITTRLSSPGSTARAKGIFDQAMRRGQYCWGRKAKLAAGAAVSIALRESHKSDALLDIAVSAVSFHAWPAFPIQRQCVDMYSLF